MFSTEEGTKLTFTEVLTSSWQGKMRPVLVRRNGGWQRAPEVLRLLMATRNPAFTS